MTIDELTVKITVAAEEAEAALDALLEKVRAFQEKRDWRCSWMLAAGTVSWRKRVKAFSKPENRRRHWRTSCVNRRKRRWRTKGLLKNWAARRRRFEKDSSKTKKAFKVWYDSWQSWAVSGKR